MRALSKYLPNIMVNWYGVFFKKTKLYFHYNMHDTESVIADKFIEFTKIVKRLRSPDGCPWDRKQSPATLKKYLIEESYELLEAIDLEDYNNIRDELGDLLFQIVFLTILFEEKGHFSIEDILQAISAKMIRRHPHVFEGKHVGSEKELRQQWEKIKEEEKTEHKWCKNQLSSFPKSLPALKRAQKVSEKVIGLGFKWPAVEDVFVKIEEEIQELKEAIHSANSDDIREELGDVLQSFSTIGAMSGVDAEDSLKKSTDKFINRFDKLEKMIEKSGKALHHFDTKTLVSLWEQAKKI